MNNTITNYVLAGMHSDMAKNQPKNKSFVQRIFSMKRHQMNTVAPHSHRFDLLSTVVRGTVTNILWTETTADDPEGDLFQAMAVIPINGGMGKYEKTFHGSPQFFKPMAKVYTAGEKYFMRAADIHSIEFSKGAIVGILEYPQSSEMSLVLEPVVDGVQIPLSKSEEWMFKSV